MLMERLHWKLVLLCLWTCCCIVCPTGLKKFKRVIFKVKYYFRKCKSFCQWWLLTLKNYAVQNRKHFRKTKNKKLFPVSSIFIFIFISFVAFLSLFSPFHSSTSELEQISKIKTWCTLLNTFKVLPVCWASYPGCMYCPPSCYGMEYRSTPQRSLL